MRPKKIVGMLAVLTLLTVASATMVTPVSAAHDLKITNYNLYALQHYGTWYQYGNGELLKWEGYPSILDVNCQKLKWVGSIPAVSVDDNQCTGWYYGQCVSLVKALSKNDVTTSNWQKGNSVMATNSVVPGTVIATFDSNGNYYGHVAVFRGYIDSSSGGRVGIMVYDQNYVSPLVVGKHDLMASGSGVNDADKYYAVRVP